VHVGKTIKIDPPEPAVVPASGPFSVHLSELYGKVSVGLS